MVNDMSGKKLDPRVLRTREILQESLLTLIKEKPFDFITVKELTDRTSLNRSTFYAHYRDKYELLIDCVLGGGRLIEPDDPRLSESEPMELARSILTDVMTFSAQNRELTLELLRHYSSSPYFSGFQKAITKSAIVIQRRLQSENQAASVPIKILAEYTVGGSIRVITQWLEDGAATPIDEMVDHILQLFFLLQNRDDRNIS